LKVTKKQLQDLLNKSKFIRHYGFQVVRSNEEACTIELPHKPLLERPGGIINGPALMAAADCAMWLAIKTRIGIDKDALTSELNTAFLSAAKGGHVYCTARILKFGRRSIYGTAECHSKEGKIFSHHTITYMPI
jgi:uncharacterized protein (TIGR00369 family)